MQLLRIEGVQHSTNYPHLEEEDWLQLGLDDQLSPGYRLESCYGSRNRAGVDPLDSVDQRQESSILSEGARLVVLVSHFVTLKS